MNRWSRVSTLLFRFAKVSEETVVNLKAYEGFNSESPVSLCRYSRQEPIEQVSKFALQVGRLADIRYEVDTLPCGLLTQILSYVLVRGFKDPVNMVAFTLSST